ncbi:hypothetical protein [Oligoflexus tunisiensis]|uniref:hypothetical protein n=1 Tax=Oligoflexus tunisiensis TaxID=708132 RepID=UPI00114CEC77|nr:hypothetical protein [Oligoflexus tunisiensis]
MKLSLFLGSQLLVATVAIGADMPATTTTASATVETQTAAPDPAEAPAATDTASGSEAVCTLSGNTRRVKMDMSQQKCQVLYYKETEKPGIEDKLWEYNHEFDKCQQNYSNFVEKLRGMSWTCS